jgi:hypothetical protein
MCAFHIWVHPGIPGCRAGRKGDSNNKINSLITHYPEKAGLHGSLLVAVGFLAAR